MPSIPPGLKTMRKLFNIRDEALSHYSLYVPITKSHLAVKSPIIYDMIMASGPQVEQLMAKAIELIDPKHFTKIETKKDHPDFGDFYEHLNRNGMLQVQKAITIEGAEVLEPFTDKNPTWWQAYNSHIKHDLPEGLKKATYHNLLKMHSAIFILHGIINLALKLGGARAKDLLSESSWLRLASYEATGELPEGEEARLVWPWLRDNLEQNRWETMHEQTELESKVIDFLTVINPSTVDTGPFYAPRS